MRYADAAYDDDAADAYAVVASHDADVDAYAADDADAYADVHDDDAADAYADDTDEEEP